MKKILFIDDDIEYQNLMKELLELEGYKVVALSSPAEAINKFKEDTFDLVISDLVMDKIDGLQLFSLLKRINSHIPVIILTGYINEEKEVQGLDLNVSEYIYKPVSMEVLLKRIERVIKRYKGDDTLVSSEKEGILMNLERRKVYKDDEFIELTQREYDLLLFFLKNKNVVLNRDVILKTVWRVTSDIIDTRTIDTHIKNLRSKLGIVSITSVRGVGYEWVE